MKKKILMICYYYPPLRDVGCRRSVALSKYISQHGWEPYVISVKNPDKEYCNIGNTLPPENVYTYYTYSIINPYKLLGKINGAISRLLTLIFNFKLTRNYLYDIFCIPDIFFGWIPFTLLKAIKLIKEKKIDLIYCSCPPVSSAVIGTFIKNITNKRLIIDFRDPIPSDVYVWKFPSPPPLFKKKLDRIIANWFFNNCDMFITTSNELKNIYITKYPQLKNKAFTIYNGFEDSIYKVAFNKNKTKFQKFTIIYAGNFYWQYGNPEIFFQALAILKRNERINTKNFQFLYYGVNKNDIKNISKKYKIDDIVSAENFREYEYIVNKIIKSHLQLLRIARPMITTKLFEGIMLNIPFLALINYKEVEDIINKYSPSSYIIKTDSPKDIINAIMDAKEKYNKNMIKDNRIYEFSTIFSRKNQILRLIDIINNQLVL